MSVIHDPEASPTIEDLKAKGIEYRVEDGDKWRRSDEPDKPIEGYVLLVDDEATRDGW